jgi:hypothetical protein
LPPAISEGLSAASPAATPAAAEATAAAPSAAETTTPAGPANATPAASTLEGHSIAAGPTGTPGAALTAIAKGRSSTRTEAATKSAGPAHSKAVTGSRLYILTNAAVNLEGVISSGRGFFDTSAAGGGHVAFNRARRILLQTQILETRLAASARTRLSTASASTTSLPLLLG